MKPFLLVTLCSVVALQSASARPLHHRHARPRVGHAYQAGMPITAQSDSIRINSVGEVISKPTPVIQKERNFDSRADKELLKQGQPRQNPNP